jgi:hypothetical protein
MSYCRWSSDDFKSDVYTYAHVDGSWTTHVAGRRRVGLDTLPENPYSREALNRADWKDLYKAYHAKLQSLEFVDIDLPHVGETFKDASPQECADTLRMLKGLGYHVPDGVIEALDDEEPEPSTDFSAVEATAVSR